jgi:hypothetical protein
MIAVEILVVTVVVVVIKSILGAYAPFLLFKSSL